MPAARLVALLLALAAPAHAPAPPGPDAALHPAPAGAPRDPVAARLAGIAAELARDRRSPRAIVPLAELHALEESLPDLSRAAVLYARTAGDRDAPVEIRALARFRLAAVERAAGSLRKSADDLRWLGFVTDWRVVGPFDDEGKRGYGTAYPPEKGIDLAATVAGKVRDVSWRELPPEAVVDGFVHLGAALQPSREVVAYALAVLDAPRDERAQLWFGGSGAAEVWVNGARAIADPGYHPARIDQAGAAVSLRKGPNRILVKLCHQDGRMGFYLRLADDRGAPRALAPVAVPPLPPAVAPGPAPAPLEGVVARLARRAAAVRGDPRAEARARLDLAIALGERQSADVDERRAAEEAGRAAALAPTDPEVLLGAATFEERRGPRRALLDAARAAAPDSPRVLRAVAREELDEGRPFEAARLLRRVVAAAPAWAGAQVDLARAWEGAGMEARAAVADAEAGAAFPTSPAAVDAAARAARRLGRLDEAAALWRKLLALRLDDGAARASLAQLLLDRGDVGGFAELEREALRLDPSDVALRLRLADVLAANGHDDAAETAYAAAIRIAPDEPEARERRGRARLAEGRAKDALQDLQAALELRPQDPRLKELVRSLEPARERFEAPYVLDARALAKAAPRLAVDDDALVLADEKVTRVFPSGLSSTWQQVVVKIGTERGADEWRRRAIEYVPDRQEIQVERARVLRPDGTSVETYDEAERSASEPWYRLYYDTRTRVLQFPTLEPGDVLELAWRVDDVAGENLLSDYFGDLTFVEGGDRKLRFDDVVLVPADRPLYANAAPGVAHATRTLPGGVVEHRFTATDVPRIDPEPGMPGYSEVARYVHVSTYATWDQVNRFYWGLVRDPLRPTAEVREAAARIAAAVRAARGGEARPTPATPATPAVPGVPGGGPQAAAPGRRAGQAGPVAASLEAGAPRDADLELALVRGVYDFVVTQTRYVGLEFGIHGYKPYRVDQILQRRFGDCKDKASLVHALLEALGIDSRLVLLRMRRLGAMPQYPASLAIFNHAIVWVPKYDLWLDGTAAYSGSRELPGEDRGATVLVVNPDGPPRFGRIPEARPGDDVSDSTFDVALSADGSAVIRGASRVAGAQAPAYRRAYQTENDRRSALEQAFNRTFPGLEVKTVSVSDLARIEDDVAMRFELAVPRYARPDGRGLSFTPFGAGQGYTEAWASLSTRKYDLVLGDPSESRFTYRYTLPKGWAAIDLPEPASADTPFGAFEVRYRADGDALVAEGHVTFKTARVAAADYPAFRAFAGAIDRAFARTVRVAPRPTEALR